LALWLAHMGHLDRIEADDRASTLTRHHAIGLIASARGRAIKCAMKFRRAMKCAMKFR
jgi:hypothetical protein